MITPAARVLICEDDSLTQLALETSLNEAGFQIVVASTAEQAIALVEEAPEKLLAVLTDIHLGSGAKGWDVARRARELVGDLPVIYVTAEGGPEWASQGVPNSILVLKPFADAQIITALSSLLNEVNIHRSSLTALGDNSASKQI